MRRLVTRDASRPAVFVDRDGTLIEEGSYLSDPDGVVLVPRAAEAIKALREAGFAVVIVTNQSGIAQGLYSEKDYRAVAGRLDELLGEAGARADRTLYCPHHPDFGDACPCRKPNTGMHLAAAAELGLDLKNSYYVGDKVSDVLPAAELGGEGILVRTGYGRDEEPLIPDGVAVVDDLYAAAQRIVNRATGVDPPWSDG